MKKNEFIKQIRQKYKMSQKKFASYLEVSKSLVEKVEMGKSPATPENKYVKAVCALEGLDNEIFKFDEITDEILKEYELTKFSKAFRRFLYFYYGDFLNEDLIRDFTSKTEKTIINYSLYKIDEFTLMLLNVDIEKLIKERFINNTDNNCLLIFHEIIIILTIYKIENLPIKPSCFKENINIYFDFLKNRSFENNNIRCIENKLKKMDWDNDEHFINIKIELMKKDLADLEDIGLPLTIENIKKLKKQKELEKIQNEIIPAPTDPKDKQICELLQYAPPAFKDKIIEKLLKFKDEVEDI